MIRRCAISLCILLILLPLCGLAEYDPVEYTGNMEVVNCSEWVSLREEPSTKARRLIKVPLGSIVHNGFLFSNEWCYAEYDGYGGYILAQYLQPSEGRLTFGAMLITITDGGAPFYSTVSSEETVDVIPTNTIVRNCHMMENGRVYVEWGSRCGFIRSEHAEVYTEMLHFPQQVLLHCNLFEGASESAASELQIDYAEGFFLANYDYSEYEMEDEGIPKAEFVLYSDATVKNVHLCSVSLSTMDAETGEAVFDATLEHIQQQVDPEHPLFVSAVIYGMMPNLAVGYQTGSGEYHFAFVEISGEDGSLYLRNF